MSTIIKFELKELRKLSSDKNSCVVEKQVKQKLALQPSCLGNLKESIKNLLDYKIGRFDKDHNGILLSYKGLQILQNVGTIRNDNPDIHFEVQADYFIFQPYVGATLRGIVNKKSITHLGVLLHRVFHVVIIRPTEEPGSKWLGASVEEGQEVVFRIVVLDLFGAMPYIRGELDESLIKIGTDGEEDLVEARQLELEPLNTSYVHLEKTKPKIHRNAGDGVSHSPGKNNSNGSAAKNKSSKPFSAVTNGKSSVPKQKPTVSEENITEKYKVKRQKHSQGSEIPSPKSLKKIKKDVHQY